MQKGQYCMHLKKIIYVKNRRFLRKDNVLWKDCCQFPCKSEESRTRPPSRKFSQDIEFHKGYDNGKNSSHKTKLTTGTGCRGMYIFAFKYPGFDRVEQSMPSTMHTVALQVKHFIRCIAGKAPEDSLAFKEWCPLSTAASSLPSAPFGRSWQKNFWNASPLWRASTHAPFSPGYQDIPWVQGG